MKKFVTYLAACACAASLMAGCSSVAAAPGSPAPTHFSSVKSEARVSASASDGADVTESAPPVGGEKSTPSLLSPTTGLEGTTDTYRPIIVQIENEPPARPQSGLQWADVVYETMIEGVDTRFTCVFNDILYADDSPEEIEVGPVRSSRYYHQWIQGEWDALYVHQGGAETAGRESYIWGESADHIKQRINGAGKRPSNAELIYRRQDTGKALEHTAYTELHADEEIMNYAPTQYQKFRFAPPESYEDEPMIDEIELCFWHEPGFVSYKYDEDKDKLIRYMGGKEFYAEETGEPLEVQNLVVQYTLVEDFPGEGGRKHIEMFGEGKADFIIHGRHLTGTWSREEGDNTPTVYRLDSGEEVTFAPGNTWIEVHPKEEEAEITYATGFGRDGETMSADIAETPAASTPTATGVPEAAPEVDTEAASNAEASVTATATRVASRKTTVGIAD